MKKNLLIASALLLLLTALLCGCQKQEDSTAPVIYWNVDGGSQRTANADGSYDVTFLRNAESVTLQVPTQEMMNYIDKERAIGLTVENGKVTAASSIADLETYYLTYDYYVQSISKKAIKVNSSSGFNGTELVINLEENTPILDVSAIATTKGEPTALQKGDGITVVANPDGSVAGVYVTVRQGLLIEVQRYCPICDKEVTFNNWFSTVSMPNIPGHYYIEEDLEMYSGAYAGVQGEITLDLNGKTITMMQDGRRFYTLGEQVILNVIDTVGGGKAVVANGGKGPQDRGMFVQQDGYGSVFNLYGGTIDGSEKIAVNSLCVDNLNGVFNMYGGTLLGGTTTGVGGGAILVQNEVNIYDGEIIGGNCAEVAVPSTNPPGGGAIRHNGANKVLNIYGGTIRSGTTVYRGGCIYAQGITNIYGGQILDGSAAEGGGIYVGLSAQVTISGDVTITGSDNGNVYLYNGQTIAIGEEGLGDATVDVYMETPGAFTSNEVPADKVGCFTAEQGKVVKNSDGTLSVKP